MKKKKVHTVRRGGWKRYEQNVWKGRFAPGWGVKKRERVFWAKIREMIPRHVIKGKFVLQQGRGARKKGQKCNLKWTDQKENKAGKNWGWGDKMRKSGRERPRCSNKKSKKRPEGKKTWSGWGAVWGASHQKVPSKKKREWGS